MKFSIVTTVYNGASTIETALTSVAKQERITTGGYRFEVEHLVIDAGSIDGTTEKVGSYPAPIRAITEPDRGVYHGMNKGITRAEGDIIGILNADDFYFYESTLVEVAQAFADPAVDVCHGNVVYVDSDEPSRGLRVWRGSPASIARMRRGWMPPHPTFFVRRECYERCGLFREDLGTAADYELMVRFLVRERLRAVYLPDLWVAMRTGGASNASLRARLRANRMDLAAWRVNELRPAPLFSGV